MFQTIKASVFIDRLPMAVFSFLKEIKPRLRLSPVYKILRFQEITNRDINKGTKFHIVLMSEMGRSEYISDVLKFVEDKRIITMDTMGRLKVRLRFEPHDRGTIFTHEEEFNLPEYLLENSHRSDEPLWLRILKDIFSLDRKKLMDREMEKSLDELKRKLSAYLEEWLLRIKMEIESIPLY